ncbi:MAG TPA: carbohydrate kinase [Leucothrix mucor]|uniref:Carbohydrate kinase n=1 Tax=Leucothrix mucor TaxID=45248 RepID=A0A7V2T4R7_LEUMU|nr:carbohydrate kinase [Leucothrix mucor]
MIKPLYAGVDFGTSGCRLVLINAKQAQVYSQQIRYLNSDKQSPEIWWNALSQLLISCPSEFKKCLQSISIDGTSGTLLLADKKGKPSSATLMYNDTRASDEAAKIAQIAPPESGAQGSSSALARFIWLLKNTSNNNHHANVLHQADWVMGMLAGEFGHSDENNCLKLGYDSINQQWPDWFDQLSIPMDYLPKVHQAGKKIALIDVQIAKLFALPLDLSIVTGTTDSIAAFIATGISRVGEAVTSLGSTLAIKFISDVPLFAPEYGIYSHRLGNNWLIGGASNSGGAVLLKYFTAQQLSDMTPLLNPEKPTGLDYYPLVKHGERFPFADLKKKPLLTPRPDSDVEYFQAMLEGIAEIESLAYQRLAELGASELSAVYSVGGGSNNKAWTQIRKNKLDVALMTPNNTEAAYGTALLALQAMLKT